MHLLEVILTLTLALFSIHSPNNDPLITPPTPTTTEAPTPTSTPKPVVLITPKPLPTPDTTPWGIAHQVSEHTWQIKIQNDPTMGTPEEILKALNDLRLRYGKQILKPDPRLCEFATSRAKYFETIKDTDAHKGFLDYLNNQNGFEKLGFQNVGENSSYGYIMTGVHLIEFVYNSDPDHSANQLDSKWDRGCVGVSGPATNLIFATSPF